MTKIQSLNAREILDSRGKPTVEVEITTTSRNKVTASVPHGVSTGESEAKDAPSTEDTQEASTQAAISNIQDILSREIIGSSIFDQVAIDNHLKSLDGTIDLSNLGANAILPISLATAKAAAKESGMPLWQYVANLSGSTPKRMPTPMFNLIEGGEHADSSLKFQEFLLIPQNKFKTSEAVQIGSKIFQVLRSYLLSKNENIASAEEGGFAPNFSKTTEALNVLKDVSEKSGFKYHEDVLLGIDAAASTFYNPPTYDFPEISETTNSQDMLFFYEKLIQDYKLVYLEDPFAERDIVSWQTIFKSSSQTTQITGDDLTTTNPKLTEKAIKENLINSIILKPNQIGTLTDVLKVAQIAKDASLSITVSHRAGETDDNAVVDIAVGICANQVKFGAPSRERIVKYNRLTKIAEELS